MLGVQACLRLVEKRETRYRVQWYYRLFEETQRGLSWGTSVEVVHGSLLALGELLRHTGRPLPSPHLAHFHQCYLNSCRFYVELMSNSCRIDVEMMN